jgi:uncharacterized protein
LDTLFFNEDRLRAGWRIAIYLAIYVALLFAAQIGASVFRGETLRWVYIIVMLVAAIVAAWIVLARLEGRPLGALGFYLAPVALRESLFGLGFGGLLILGAAVLLLATGSAYFVEDDGTVATYLGALASTFVFFALAAAWEEVLFRGYAFQALVEGVGPWPATLAASVLFTLAHADNPNVTWFALANIFLASVMLSLAYLRTRSLWFATGVHLGWNWVMASVFDFPVSGLLFDTPLYSSVDAGADWWTGGGFGPEAGLVGTLVLLPATLWIARTPRLRPSAPARQVQPIVDRRLGPEWE